MELHNFILLLALVTSTLAAFAVTTTNDTLCCLVRDQLMWVAMFHSCGDDNSMNNSFLIIMLALLTTSTSAATRLTHTEALCWQIFLLAWSTNKKMLPVGRMIHAKFNKIYLGFEIFHLLIIFKMKSNNILTSKVY